MNRTYPNLQFAASCGSGGNRFTATGLPNNLTLGLTTGIISGTPTTVGTYTVTGTVTDSIGEQDLVTYTLRINPPPTISTTSLPNWTINRDYPGTPVSVTARHRYCAVHMERRPGCPTGLSINAANGTGLGTPSATGTFNPTVTVTDVAGATATAVVRGHDQCLTPDHGPRHAAQLDRRAGLSEPDDDAEPTARRRLRGRRAVCRPVSRSTRARVSSAERPTAAGTYA